MAAAALAKLVLAPTCKPWLANPSPSWRQATIASRVPQPSPHTRPQRGWSPSPAPTATSTRPSKRLRPPLSRICGERRWQRHHRHRRCSPCMQGCPLSQAVLQRLHTGMGEPKLSRAKHSFSWQGSCQNWWIWGQQIACEFGNCLTSSGKTVHFEMASFQK